MNAWCTKEIIDLENFGRRHGPVFWKGNNLGIPRGQLLVSGDKEGCSGSSELEETDGEGNRSHPYILLARR